MDKKLMPVSEKTDLALIKPGGRLQSFGDLGSALSGFAPPLDIGLLAGYLREKGYAVKVIDADAEFLTPEETANRIAEYNPLLAAVFAYTIRMVHAGATLKALRSKAPHIKTLLGGRHPSALPEKTLKEEAVDYVCQGEGFYPLAELLDILKSGKELKCDSVRGIWHKRNEHIIPSMQAPLLRNLDELPLIAWDLLPVDKYRAHNWQCFGDLGKRNPYAIIYTSIGCPFECSYCCVNAVYGKPGIRLRSPAKVLEEIDCLVKNYDVRNIRIVDDIFTLKPERVIRICDLIIQRGYDLNMWCYGRVDMLNEIMLRKMRQAGINWICFGIEAGQEKVREGVHKRIESKKMREGLEMAQAADINIIANFIFGLPDDDFRTMQSTLDMARDYNFEYVNFYTAMAWPGSKLYEESLRKGVRLPETWAGYAQLSEETLPLPTKYVTAADVLRFRDKAFVEYFSNPGYLKMIAKKFGPDTVNHIRQMLQMKIRRKYAQPNPQEKEGLPGFNLF